MLHVNNKGKRVSKDRTLWLEIESGFELLSFILKDD